MSLVSASTSKMVCVENTTKTSSTEVAEDEPQQQKTEEEEEEEEAMCRICHVDTLPVSSLVSPCRCSGTMAYVHPACLRKWVLKRGSLQCELCDYDFQARFEQRHLSCRRKTELYRRILQRVWRRFLAAMSAMYSRNVIYILAPECFALVFLGIYLGVATHHHGFWPTIFADKNVRIVSCFFSSFLVGFYAMAFLSSVGLCILRAMGPEPCRTVLTFYSASIMLSFMTHAIISHLAPSQHHLSSDGRLVPGPAPVPAADMNATYAGVAAMLNGTAEHANDTQTAGVSLELPIPLLRFYMLAVFVSLLILVYPLYRVVVHTRTNIRVHLSHITFENYSKSKEKTEREARASLAKDCHAELHKQRDGGVQGATCVAVPHIAVQMEELAPVTGKTGRAQTWEPERRPPSSTSLSFD